MIIDALMRSSPVIPVLVIDDVRQAEPIALAFVAGGLTTLEVTLRTPAALEVIRIMASVQGAVVGAGTVLNPRDLETAVDAGARFAVSPGLTEPLAKEAITSGIPFLPGVATSADIMRGLDLGLDRFKFFPAEAAGGLKAFKALSAVFRSAGFCPTGGITAQTARDWLAEPAVLCVGGSWLIGSGPLNPSTIEEAAREATHLRKDNLSTDPKASTSAYTVRQ